MLGKAKALWQTTRGWVVTDAPTQSRPQKDIIEDIKRKHNVDWALFKHILMY